MTNRPAVLASIVLSLALLGDTFLYATLPLHAASFDLSMIWVGVLLSANRTVRLVAYPRLPALARVAGLRRLTIASAALGSLSTLWFALASDPWLLLALRIAWGISFGSLSLAALAYAMSNTKDAGARVGESLSLRELGPILSLTAGMLLLPTFGMRPTLASLGAVSLLALPVAMLLPEDCFAVRNQRSARVLPATHERTSAIVGFVADGMFPATIALLLVPSFGVNRATGVAAGLLIFKRVAILVVSPIGGRVADRIGVRWTMLMGLAITATGAFGLAAGNVRAGAAILLSGSAITATALPLTATAGDLSALARLSLARDAGAALGPLLAFVLLRQMGPSALYSAAGVLLAACALVTGLNGHRLNLKRLIQKIASSICRCLERRPASAPCCSSPGTPRLLQ